MSGPNLYELSDTLRAVLAKIDAAADVDGAGELPADLEQELDDAAVDFAAKVDGVLRARVNLLAQAEGVDVEVRRLTALRDGYARRADWLKAYVKNCLLATGQQRLDTKLFRVTIAKNAQPSVKIDDGADVPPDLARIVPAYTELDRPATLTRWRAWRAAMDAYERYVAKIEAAQAGDYDPATLTAMMEECEAARVRAMELALPPCVRVIEGSHVRIR